MSPALPVLLTELVDALDDGASWTRYHYLDRTTGEIDTALTEEVDETGNFADVRADPQRYIPIEPQPVWLRKQLRVRFVEQEVQDPALRLDLMEALQGTRPLPEFQRLLRNHATVMQAFLAFRTNAFSDAAREWMLTHKLTGVELR